MSYYSEPGAVGLLILLPIIIVIGGTFSAIKLSEVGGAKWEQLQTWRRKRTRAHKRTGSDDPQGCHDFSDTASSARPSEERAVLPHV